MIFPASQPARMPIRMYRTRFIVAGSSIRVFLLLPLAIWTAQSSGVTVRLRGISAVGDTVAWASGARGTILRTTDGGTTWTKLAVPDADALDFRDIDAVDARTAYVLSIGKGAASRIYKTTDAGAHWDRQFVATEPDAFLDAMAFWD